MLDIVKQIIIKIEDEIHIEYQKALNELANLRYTYDADHQRSFLSGKIQAYEKITLILKKLH